MGCRCWGGFNKEAGRFDLNRSKGGVVFRLPTFLLHLHSFFETKTPHPSRCRSTPSPLRGRLANKEGLQIGCAARFFGNTFAAVPTRRTHSQPSASRSAHCPRTTDHSHSPRSHPYSSAHPRPPRLPFRPLTTIHRPLTPLHPKTFLTFGIECSIPSLKRLALGVIINESCYKAFCGVP